MQIYLARNNEQAGPYSLEQVNQMLASGQVVLTDLAWHEGMSEWQPLGNLTNGQLVYQPSGSPFQSQPVPTQSSQSQPAAATTSVNQHNKNAWASHNQSARSTVAFKLASVNKRVLAKIIDILLLWLPSSFIFGQFVSPEFVRQYQTIAGQSVMPTPEQQEQLLNLLGTLPSGLFWAVGIYTLLYFVIQAFFLYKSGQSIGKKALKIKIVDEQNGQTPPLTRSFLIRSIVFIIINYFAFFFIIIDFAFIFSERRRTLHDRMAKTLVVDVD